MNRSLALPTERMTPPYFPFRSRTTGSSGMRSLSGGSLPALTMSASIGASDRLAGTLSSRYVLGFGASATLAAAVGAAAAGFGAGGRGGGGGRRELERPASAPRRLPSRPQPASEHPRYAACRPVSVPLGGPAGRRRLAAPH